MDCLEGQPRRHASGGGGEPLSQHDELPLDYLQGQKDGLEWAARLAEANHPQTGDWLYDDPLELAKAIRKGPNMPEAAGNSPVILDGWVACSERMPEKMVSVLATGDWFDYAVTAWDGGKWLDFDYEPPVTHWTPLPAAPQQEAFIAPIEEISVEEFKRQYPSEQNPES